MFKLTLVSTLLLLSQASSVLGNCPFMDGGGTGLHRRQTKERLPGDDGFFDQFTVDDTDVFMTTDFGTPVADRTSLKAGERGPTLLEDFVLRTKITRFDHERVPERAVHARGAAAHGYFESYGNFDNITAASFLSAPGKQTPVFLRFSTVAGSRGSADTVRDVHGFALRFYTEAGNYDIVGNNIPVFFIQDAMQFPDLVHSVKPEPHHEMPQAGTAHDTAWDFFGQNPSTMHTLIWALSGHGIPRSYRHMHGFGVHTFRFVTDDGKSKLIKWHFKTKQGLAHLVWPEAQVWSGLNPDAHRADLFEAIENGDYPEWEVGVQIMDEKDALKYGFDLLDPTKLVPETLVPVTPLGKLVLNRNPINYFAETEQVMMNPGHVVRGIDFSEDPLLQGRLFSYVDTQLNRHGGPNFEQVPINQPHHKVHNNNRDGAGQNLLHKNRIAYGKNSLNNGSPKLATQNEGRGFFTAPIKKVVDGSYVRNVSPTFLDFWTQPRLFFNSLNTVEQQFVVNAYRFELSKINSFAVREVAIGQINRISNNLAKRIAIAIGVPPPAPDGKYYHDKKTTGFSFYEKELPNIKTLHVGILATQDNAKSLEQAKTLAAAFKAKGAYPVIIAETIKDGIGQAYVSANAVFYDGIIATDGTEKLFKQKGSSASTLFPAHIPDSLIREGYAYGKPLGFIGGSKLGLQRIGVDGQEDGVYVVGNNDLDKLVTSFEAGLKRFKFLNRFSVDK